MAAADRKRSQINFNIDSGRLARLDDYRFRRRFPTRTEALLHLLDFALDADPPRPDPQVQ